jgi:hypothetical protein
VIGGNVSSEWMIVPAADRQARDRLSRAHTEVIEGRALRGVRRLVQESWQRSLQSEIDPDLQLSALEFDDDDLREYRSAHPLSLVLPIIHRLLVRHTYDAGLIIAVGDQAGRLLWIDGDRELRRKAEGMLFVEGANWSEAAVGTSAPGTALALDHGIQIQGAEHFTRIVHPWSCTAVPVHDPHTGAVLGVIDITGGEDAVAPATLPLLEAAVAAVEAELRLVQLLHDQSQTRAPIPLQFPLATQAYSPVSLPRATESASAQAPAQAPVLSILGREGGCLDGSAHCVELSMRHAEILTLLSWHSQGLSAEKLAGLLYEQDNSVTTLRAEMVRLRKCLEALDVPVVVLSKPYRLEHPLELDASRVLAFLDRGAHKVALAAYAGPLLPRSTAPGIVAIRAELRGRLREALLSDAALDTLLAYAATDEAAYDVPVWRECLRLLPAKSPKRAGVVAHLERIENELNRSV